MKYLVILSLVGMVAYGQTPSATSKASEPACFAFGMPVVCDGSWYPKTVRDDSVCKVYGYSSGYGWACVNGYGVRVVEPIEWRDTLEPKNCPQIKGPLIGNPGECAVTVPKPKTFRLPAYICDEDFNGTRLTGCAYYQPKKSVKKKHFPISYATGGGGDAVSDKPIDEGTGTAEERRGLREAEGPNVIIQTPDKDAVPLYLTGIVGFTYLVDAVHPGPYAVLGEDNKIKIMDPKHELKCYGATLNDTESGVPSGFTITCVKSVEKAK